MLVISPWKWYVLETIVVMIISRDGTQQEIVRTIVIVLVSGTCWLPVVLAITPWLWCLPATILLQLSRRGSSYPGDK